ncbi:EAL domain-containing protein [Fusibacter paucivorans]|uniref:EAL domain-containing protein n=1 Tax=Fusibacter paucivorans TaxID=76009 RepID=A0ABS5PNZ2_9FIRM|nr:EAL domain-containing protein [Fusibacter paucivorans]MBS7526306.1 EAL domain-containing protein [Fusibacter paucivorans]
MKSFYKSNGLSQRSKWMILIMALVMTFIANAAIIYIHNIAYREMMAKYNHQQNTALKVSELFMKESFQTVYDDMGLLKTSYSMMNYLDTDRSELARDELENMFYRYAGGRNGLSQIRILDMDGNELVRVNRRKADEVVERVSPKDLQNKADRYYYQSALDLREGEMYISDFDLNIENGVIVVPYEPTIRFARKVYDGFGNEAGILVLNFDGDRFFSIIGKYKELNLEQFDIGLADSNNYWSFIGENLERMSDLYQTTLGFSVESILTSIENRKQTSQAETVSWVEDDVLYMYEELPIFSEEHYVFDFPENTWYLMTALDIQKALENENLFLNHFYTVLLALDLLVFILTFSLAVLFNTKNQQNMMLLVSAYISNNSHDGIVILDEKLTIQYCNSIFEEIFGFTLAEILGKPIRQFFSDNRITFSKDEETDLWDGNVWNRTKRGHMIRKHLLIKAVRNRHNEIRYYIGIYANPKLNSNLQLSAADKDITSSFITDDEIERVGSYLDERFEGSAKYMVVALQVKDRLGAMLEANQSIQGNFVRKSSTILNAMMPENTFIIPHSNLMVLASEVSDSEKDTEEHITEIIQRMEQLLRKVLFDMNLSSFSVKFHAGVACRGDNDARGGTIVGNALIALEALLKLKRSNYLVYTDQIYNYVKEDMSIRKALLHAFDEDEYYVLYQPQVNFETNEIEGVEALVRWQSSELGIVSPNKFVPLLEDTKEILRLGKRVLEKVIDDLERLNPRRSDGEPLRISINLSSIEFTNSVIMMELIEMIRNAELQNYQFCFEIIETTLMDNIAVANMIIEQLHLAGIEIAIDDFGSGYSSLAYLKEINADELKIDRLFIKDYPETDDGKIIKAIIRMGKEIGIRIVVEGVETELQYRFVKGAEAELYQGYYMSKPVLLDTLFANNHHEPDE